LIVKNSQLFVSVVIPVFNDSERLKLCLKALENQTYPRDSYEVIVVDNGSDSPVELAPALFPQVQVAQESRPGSYAARNAGIMLSRGDVIAFTDSDCIPAADWIEKGVAALLSVPNCGLVAGQVKVFAQNPTHPTMSELYEMVFAFPQEENIKQKHFGVTANLFTFRDVIEKVGLFDANLKSAGDVKWTMGVYSYGYKQVYADDVCVLHPARRSLREIYKKHIRISGGHHDIHPSNRPRFLRFTKHLVLGLLNPFIHLIYQGKARRIFSDPQLQGIKQKTQVIFVLFFAQYTKTIERLRLILGEQSRRG